MFLAFSLGDIITVPFGYLLSFLYDVTANYGVALIIFAVLVRFILLPATAKGKKSTMKMSRLTPQVQAIQKKYANDQQKQSEALQALYKEEGVSMGGGCLWSLLPLLVLFPLYSVVREPITYMLHESKETAAAIVEAIKVAAGGAFGGNVGFEQMTAASLIAQYASEIRAALPEISQETLQGVNFSFLGINLGAVPQWKFWQSGWTWNWATIGAALLPVISAGSQVISMLINQKMNNSLVTDEKGLEDKEAAKNSQANQSGKVMMYMMPAMSLIFGFSVPGALSLYWIAQGVVTTVTDMWLTQKYRKIYDAEDAVKLQKALAEEAEEEEKERIRAERRAANPDGITTNTSKKKMQQNKQREEEAAKAAAAKEYAVKKGIVVDEPEEKTVMSGITERPYCKGRAYDPNRYTNTEE